VSERYSWQRITRDLARVVAEHPRWLADGGNRAWMANADFALLKGRPGTMRRINRMQAALEDIVYRHGADGWGKVP
jgi:hypothetical protein